MAARLIILVLVAVRVVVMAGPTDTAFSDHATILSASQGPMMMKQCSRHDPADISGFWMPSTADVAALEKRLPELLRASGHKIDLSDSYRQYVGIVSRGKKLIYLNAFSGTVFVHPPLRRSWRTEAMIVCVGGDVFWGVEFDPATNTFDHLEFNGAI